MRRYLINVLGFSVGLLLLNLAAYFAISRPVLLKDYLVTTDSLPHYRSYLMADSHGAVVDPAHLAQHGIYNFAFGSDSYCDMYNKLSFLYQEEGVEVDTLFISVDDHTLSPYREQINNLNRSVFYATVHSYEQYSEGGGWSFYVDRYLLPYLPLFDASNSRLFFRYLLEILSSSGADQPASEPKEPDRHEDGFPGSYERMKFQFPEGEKSVQLSKCLQDIARLCQRQRTVLIGVKFPLSADYRRVLDDKSYRADQLLAPYSVTIVDLKSAFGNNNALFRDTDHVNQVGAKKFTQLLVQQAKQPG